MFPSDQAQNNLVFVSHFSNFENDSEGIQID